MYKSFHDLFSKCITIYIAGCLIYVSGSYELCCDRVNSFVCDKVNRNTKKIFTVHSGIIKWNSLTHDIKLCNNVIICLNRN